MLFGVTEQVPAFVGIHTNGFVSDLADGFYYLVVVFAAQLDLQNRKIFRPPHFLLYHLDGAYADGIGGLRPAGFGDIP